MLLCLNFFIFYLCVWYMNMFVTMHMCGGQKSMLDVFLDFSLPYFFKTGFVSDLQLADSARLAGQ